MDEYKDGKKLSTPFRGLRKRIRDRDQRDAETGFTVTNTKTPPGTPKTGDNTNLGLYFWTMMISGGALALLPITMKRKRRD
jgi:hypothetical protein